MWSRPSCQLLPRFPSDTELAEKRELHIGDLQDRSCILFDLRGSMSSQLLVHKLCMWLRQSDLGTRLVDTSQEEELDPRMRALLDMPCSFLDQRLCSVQDHTSSPIQKLQRSSLLTPLLAGASTSLSLLRRNNCVDRVWLLSESNNGQLDRASRSLDRPRNRFRDHRECSSVHQHQGKHDLLDKVGKYPSQVLRPLLSCIIFCRPSQLGSAILLDTLCKQRDLLHPHNSQLGLYNQVSEQIRLDLGKQTQQDSSKQYRLLVLHIDRA